MKYSIIYDKPGRIRFRFGAGAFTQELESAVIKFFISEKYVTDCDVHYENGGVLVCYENDHREDLIKLASSVCFRKLEPVEDNEHSIKSIDRKFRSDLAKLIALRYIKKALLPVPFANILIIINGLGYAAKGLKTLLNAGLTVEVLDGASISACLVQKNYKTAGSVIFLLSVSSLLEDYTRARTRAALTESLAVKTDKVWLVPDDGEQDTLIPMEELKAGDMIRVRTGSIIPVDGEITDGEACINESSMTGEPLAVMKTVSDTVFAGTVIEEGSVVIRVRNLSSDSKLSKIIELIDNSENLKAGVQSEAEHLADRIVPYSFLAFGLILLFTGNITKALSVLMVDYSCAIKLSAPIAVISAIKEAADHDVTVKGGKYLEEFAMADTIVFDKTGTLTNAEPVLDKVIPFGKFTEEYVLKTAACLEEHFPHSVARAIVKGASDRNIDHAEEHAQVEYIVAHGIATMLHEKRAVIGSRHFVCEDEGIKISVAAQKKIDSLAGSDSVIYLAVGGKLAGALCINDPPRTEAADVISKLKDYGIDNTVMLTGDSSKAAEITAEKLGISSFKAQVLPEDKHSCIESLKSGGHKVIMIGDGINDAPALAAANVSAAMSDASDIAREAADITLRNSDLNDILFVRRLSSKLMKRINSNYSFIIWFNSFLIASGLTGFMTPSVSALLHNASTMAICAYSMTPLEESKDKK